MSIKTFRNKYEKKVVHCATHLQIESFFIMAKKCGCNIEQQHKRAESEYGGQLCFRMIGNCLYYSPIDFYKANNYEVIEYEQI